MNVVIVIGSALLGCFVVWLALRLLPWWDAFTARYTADLVAPLNQLGVDTRYYPLYMQIWGVVLVAVPLMFAFVFQLPLLALFVAYLLFIAPRILVRVPLTRQRLLLRDQIVTACVNLANTTRAGLSLPQGLESIIPETGEPLALEFRRVHGEFQRGRPFEDTLRDSAERIKMDPYTLFVSAILVCLKRGGKVTDALDRISVSLLENQRIERKREADTASGRQVVTILACVPFAFLGLLFLMDSEGASLIFTNFYGQIILTIVAILDFVSVRWARAILKLDAAVR